MIKFALKYGGIGAAISIVLTLVFFAFDTPAIPGINIAVMLGVLIWGQIAYKNSEELAISYGETFGLGGLVILVFAAVYAAYMMLHWSVIDTDMTVRVLQQAEVAVQQESGISDAQRQAAIDIQKMIIGPVISPVIGFLTSMLGGAVMALITSIFTRKAVAN